MNSIFTRVMRRPDTSVEFYNSTDEYNQFIKENYIDTGKCLVWREREFLDDEQLVIMIRSVWTDKDMVTEMLENELVIEDGFAQVYYNLTHDIETLSVDLDGEYIMKDSES